MEMNYSMLLIWLFPLLGGILGFCIGKKNKNMRNDWVDIVMFVELIMLLCMGYQIAKNWSTLSMELDRVLGFGLMFEMNTARLIFCLLTTIVFGTVSFFMKESIREEKGSNRFYMLYLSVYSMIMGAWMTPSIYNMIIFVTIALLLIYPMIVHRQNAHAVKSAGVYLIYVIFAVAFFLVGMVLVLGYIGAISFEQIHAGVLMRGANAAALAGGWLLWVVFAIYSGLFPVQLMMTRGCTHGLMEGSVLLSSLVSKLGIYGMMMLATTIFHEDTIYGKVLVVFAILTTIGGLSFSFLSTDIRRIISGLNMAINGFISIGISFMSLSQNGNTLMATGSICLLIMSLLSVFALYMVALELVRKNNTFEIKGLIASGKGNRTLMAGCFLIILNLTGVPGTLGYLGFSSVYKSIQTVLGWKWLIALYVIMWAFFMAAAARIFMKLFVSKKDEALRVLSVEEKNESEEDADGDKKPQKSPYLLGEVLLIVTGILQLVIGMVPMLTVEKVSDAFYQLFFCVQSSEASGYYTIDGIIVCVVAAVLAILLYINLVHGVLLRAIRNKKNKELKTKMEE